MKTSQSMFLTAGAISFVWALLAPAVCAEQIQSADYFVLRPRAVVLVREGLATPVQDQQRLAPGILLKTNAVLEIDGVEKQLQDGQRLTLDGQLITGAGLIVPVRDHVLIQNNQVTLVRDGTFTPVDKAVTLGDGTRITTEPKRILADGRQARLQDGHRFLMDGTPIPPADYVTLRDGKVLLQKDGALVALDRSGLIVMSDGTRVSRDGTIHLFNGNEVRLGPNDRLVLDGAAMAAPR